MLLHEAITKIVYTDGPNGKAELRLPPEHPSRWKVKRVESMSGSSHAHMSLLLRARCEARLFRFFQQDLEAQLIPLHLNMMEHYLQSLSSRHDILSAYLQRFHADDAMVQERRQWIHMQCESMLSNVQTVREEAMEEAGEPGEDV